MHDVLEQLDEKLRDKLSKRSFPKRTSPMLAILHHDPFSDAEWLYERKLDGERCLVFKQKKAELRSRNNKSLDTSYPEIVEALNDQDGNNFIIDGEIVAFEGDVTSFQRLQNRMQLEDPEEARNSGVAVYFYVFDILYFDGYDLTNLPLESRKSILRNILEFDNRIRFTQHRNEQGKDYLKEACDKGWEGLIAKKRDSTYAHSRSKQWLKFKCANRQEFVIGGYTEPEGERIGFGALLIGYYEKNNLKYAGKVGTGYDDETLERLSKKLSSLERKTSSFDEEVSDSDVHWVTPELVAQVEFSEWTQDHRLRHPRFQGLRRDKDAKDVTREQ